MNNTINKDKTLFVSIFQLYIYAKFVLNMLILTYLTFKLV